LSEKKKAEEKSTKTSEVYLAVGGYRHRQTSAGVAV